MATLTATRIGEIKSRGRKTLSDNDLDQLIILALDQLAQAGARARRDHETDALRASLAEETARLEKVTRLYSETVQTLAGRTRDLAATDNYAQSLIRRLQDAVAEERTIRAFQGHFVEQVHNCIDHKELSPECSAHPTLLRLQEALEPEVAEAAPAE